MSRDEASFAAEGAGACMRRISAVAVLPKEQVDLDPFPHIHAQGSRKDQESGGHSAYHLCIPL